MKIFTQRAVLYARDSLKVYADLRKKAKALVTELKRRGIDEVYLTGNDEMMDILRLTCIEDGISLSAAPNGVTLRPAGQGFEAIYAPSPGQE
jgi:hypothetical protein